MSNFNANNVQIGDLIRSYDFPIVEDSYMEGLVTAIEGDFIHCDCFAIVREGLAVERAELPASFRTPKQGCDMFDHIKPRITEAGTAR